MSSTDYGLDLEIRNEFIDEALDDLTAITSLFVELESGAASKDAIDRIFRVAHTIKGNSAYFDLFNTKALAHQIENVLAELRKDVLFPTPRIVSALLAGTDELASMLVRAREGQPELADPGLFEHLLAELAEILEKRNVDLKSLWDSLLATLESGCRAGAESAAEHLDAAQTLAIRIGRSTVLGQEAISGGTDIPVPGAKPDPAEPPVLGSPADPGREKAAEAGAQKQKPEAGGKTMRVTESSIDCFLSFVGDLVVLQEMYENLQSHLAGSLGNDMVKELRQANEAFSDLALNLQKSIMEIRKVPVGNLMQRMPRIIRDVATAKGKLVETTLEGAEIMIDKSLVEILEGPLVHMVRNAADHGIESPQDRLAAGKPETGRVWISATETADHLTLVIRDDGKGLDRPALARKGAELGLVAEGRELSDADVLALLFSAGVSTSETVSDISGRGVGMDVARQNVESGGGQIKVSSEWGKGSVFTIEIRKSVNTQIIDGFTIIDQGNHYIIPLERIVKCIRPTGENFQNALGKGTFVRDGDEIIAVHDFGKLCGRESDRSRDPGQSILLVLQGAGTKTALQVDEIDSVKRVVLKEVNGLSSQGDLFSGGAVLGNGNVAMVVDVDAVLAQTAAVLSDPVSAR